MSRFLYRSERHEEKEEEEDVNGWRT